MKHTKLIVISALGCCLLQAGLARADSKNIQGDAANRLYNALADIHETKLCGLPARVAEVSCDVRLSCILEYRCEVIDENGQKHQYRDNEINPGVAGTLFATLPGDGREKHDNVLCYLTPHGAGAICNIDTISAEAAD